MQFSYTSQDKSDAPDGDDQDNMKNLNYFCSRPSDWGGIITELDDPNEKKSEQESQSSSSGGDDDTLVKANSESPTGNDVPTVELPPDVSGGSDAESDSA